jgi:hypothetical protein
MPRASARRLSKRIRGIARLRASRLCDTRQHRSGQRKVPQGRGDAERLTADVTRSPANLDRAYIEAQSNATQPR